MLKILLRGGLVHFGTLSEPRGSVVAECRGLDIELVEIHEFLKCLKSY